MVLRAEPSSLHPDTLLDREKAMQVAVDDRILRFLDDRPGQSVALLHPGVLLPAAVPLACLDTGDLHSCLVWQWSHALAQPQQPHLQPRCCSKR